MPVTMRIVRLTQVRAHPRPGAPPYRNLWLRRDVPREDALERVTEATVTAYDAATRRSRGTRHRPYPASR